MFVGKFNFSKVCSNVFSPAFRDLPPAEKAKVSAPQQRERHHARSRKALQDQVGSRRGGAIICVPTSRTTLSQNAALDRKTSDFTNRSRRKKGDDDATAIRRGLSAGPQLRKSSKYQVRSISGFQIKYY